MSDIRISIVKQIIYRNKKQWQTENLKNHRQGLCLLLIPASIKKIQY